MSASSGPTDPNPRSSDSTSDVNGAAEMEPWRRRIDEIDRTVLQLLNERAACANEIGAIKNRLGLPIYVPSREEDVLNNVSNANEGPLPREAVRRLFERIIDETRSLERRTYQPPRDRCASPVRAMALAKPMKYAQARYGIRPTRQICFDRA